MSIYILITFLIIVSVWDMRTFEIPSAFIMIGIALGFLFTFTDNSWEGLKFAIFSLFMMFIITFSIWAIGEFFFGASIIGAGDMKLLMVIATFLGVNQTLYIFYFSIIVAGFLFLFMIPPKQIFSLFKNIFRFFVYAIPKSKGSTKKIAFSVPITLTTIFILFV